jgi:hypothetical protein
MQIKVIYLSENMFILTICYNKAKIIITYEGVFLFNFPLK